MSHKGIQEFIREMCASQNMPVYINYNGNDPKINRVLPLPQAQGNHVAKFGKDPIYRTKVILRKGPC